MAQYITLVELGDLGTNPKAFADIEQARKLQVIAAVSDLIDGYLGRFVLPLLVWGNDIKQCCATLTSVQLIRNRGTSADAADRYDHDEDRWMTWLKSVSAGTTVPRVTDSSSGSSTGVSAPRPVVISACQRGFSVRGTGNPRGAFQGN